MYVFMEKNGNLSLNCPGYPVLFGALHYSEVQNICFMYLLIANDPCHEVHDRLIIAWHKVKIQI